MPRDPSNTLYVASERLSLPGKSLTSIPGSGVFELADRGRCLARRESLRPSQWSLPLGFLPRGRPPLSYHDSPARWSEAAGRANLAVVSRGQEFVLDLEYYPELTDWLAEVIGTRPQPRASLEGLTSAIP
jgi:hypothetical protein